MCQRHVSARASCLVILPCTYCSCSQPPPRSCVTLFKINSGPAKPCAGSSISPSRAGLCRYINYTVSMTTNGSVRWPDQLATATISIRRWLACWCAALYFSYILHLQSVILMTCDFADLNMQSWVAGGSSVANRRMTFNQKYCRKPCG